MQRSILTERNYLTYLSGSIFSTQGLWIQRMTLGWMMWQQTHSESELGLLAFLMFFPSIIFGPLFGVLVDRIDRRRAAVSTSLLLGAIAFLLALLTHENLVDAHLLLMFSLLIGLSNSLYQAIRLSFVPELVSTHNIPKAVAINAIVYNTSRFIGPVIAGYLINEQGEDIALFVVAASYIPLTFVLLIITLNVKLKSPNYKHFTFFDDMKAGLQHAFSSKLISKLLLSIMVSAVLGRGLLEILPAASEILYQGDVKTLAWLNAIAGIGAILAGLVLSGVKPTGLLVALRAAIMSSGVLLTLFSLSSSVEIGLFLIGSLSFCATICGVATQSIIQVTVSGDFRGRVMSLWGAINLGGGAIGGLAFGLMTDFIGYNITFISLGLICLLMAHHSTKKISLR